MTTLDTQTVDNNQPVGEETKVVAPVENASNEPTDANKPVDDKKAETPKPDEKKRDRQQERYNELTRQRYQYSQEAEAWRGIVESVTSEPAPIRSDYATAEEYAEAIAEYKTRVAVPKTMLQKAESQVQQVDSEYESELASSWDEKIAASGIKNFNEIVAKSNLPLPRDLKIAILESDVGPHIVMHLIDNPHEALALSKMGSFQQGKVLRELESNLKNKQVTPKVLSKQEEPTPPVETVVKGRSSGGSKDPGQMTLEEYSAWRKGK